LQALKGGVLAQSPHKSARFIVGLLTLVLLSATSASSQDKNLTIEWHQPPISDRNTKSATGTQVVSQIDVLEITGVAIDGNPIKLGQSFAANDSWLEKLTFRLKNVSSVKLSKVQMNLFLPEIMPGGPMVTFCYGCGPTLGRSISPGEEVEMKVVFYNWLSGEIKKKRSLSEITKAEINDVTVAAADGRMWLSGCVRAADPANACPP
jgi:hypothetical protein